jgi:cation diffusion facilitator family transporter
VSVEGSTKAVLAAMAANAGIAVTKFLAWVLTGASSMLAEAIHSVADTSNQALLLLGGRRARKRATSIHQFGYGRARYVYAFVVSIVLFSLGGLFAMYEAWHKYEEVRAGEPNELTESSWWWVPLVVLLLAMVMEGLSFRTAIRESNKIRGEQSWPRFIRRAKAPELPVVLLEDFGALLGLVMAFVGISLTLITDNGAWDAMATAGIGVLLVVIAVTLALEMGSLLVGEGAVPETMVAIRGALEGTPGIERVIHLRTLYLGPDELLVAAKVGVQPGITAGDLARLIDAAEADVRTVTPVSAVIYIEPDIYRARGEVTPEA